MFSKDLLQDIDILYKSENYHDEIFIGYLSEDTRDLQPNTCFICIEGSKADGHDFVRELDETCVLIIAMHQIDTKIPYIIVPNTLRILPSLAIKFYHNPSARLKLIGVTGTDGKTTTALIMKQLIDLTQECAYIGTNGFIYKNNHLENPLTTPKPIMLNKYLSIVAEENIPYTTLEVSSQGLDLHRIDKLKFKAAIFTNLTHEHLDYHETLENYFAAKLKLFKMLDKDAYAVVNLDSPYAEAIINATKAKVITYGKDIRSDFCIGEISTTLSLTTFDLITKENSFKDIQLSLFGDYNVYNAVASLACLATLGFDLNTLIPRLKSISDIEGRMEIVDCGQPFKVIVDFAHTPNALKSILSNLKKLNFNNLTIVFGAAGERDKTKRPLMGNVANIYASRIFLTSEDPKSEDTLQIIKDIIMGIDDIFKVTIIPNRKEAIEKALALAEPGDVVLITGKGNEKYEIFNGYKIAHNDIQIVQDYLTARPANL